ncbi:unnamed protein product, partial [Rotaria magnacalcarata]
MMIVEQHLLAFVLINFLSRQLVVHGIAGRCYLCSQRTLGECAGNNPLGAAIYTT